MTKFFKSNKYALLTAGIAALVMIITLFVLRLGVADNGYLTQRLVSMGLYDAYGASGTGYYSVGFGVADKSFSFMPSAFVYYIFKLIFPVDSVIPAVLPAIVYTIFAVWGIYMIVKALTADSKINNILLCVLTVLIAADGGYTTYFNTPYECGAAIAYFIPMLGALLMSLRYDKISYTIIFAIFGFLFAGSMPQTGATGILIAIFAVYMLVKSERKIQKVLFSVSALLIVLSSVFALGTMTDADKYNAVFYGVASNENPAYTAVLSNLKIIGKDDLAGVAYFESEAQEFINSPEFDGVMRNVSPLNTGVMYSKNPIYARETVNVAAQNSMFVKTDYLGNYPILSNGAGISNFFTFYSSAKRVIVPGKILALAIIFLLVIFFAFEYRKKYALNNGAKNTCVLCVLLSVAAFISLFIPLLYFGKAQISFNLIIYNVIFDCLVAFAVVGGTRLLDAKRGALREKFGVNQ